MRLHKELKGIPEHMKELGLGILAQAQKNACFGSHENTLDEGIFGVLQAAHSCEIIIKSIIAEQHPLLIFSNLPHSQNHDLLDIQSLFEKGQTIAYNKLPEVLWAATGYKVKNSDKYVSFGRLRNNIQHFSYPRNVDFGQETIEFIYQVIDPIINNFWKLHAVKYCDIWSEHEDKEEQLLVVLNSRYPKFSYPETLKEKVGIAKNICKEIYDDPASN